MPVRTRKPSVRSLERAFPGKGEELRKLLDSDDAVNAHPRVVEWVKECWHEPRMAEKRMMAIDAVLENYGVEHVPAGRGGKSPAFSYSNAGDIYAVTILRVDAVYRIGTVGDIIERRNYFEEKGR